MYQRKFAHSSAQIFLKRVMQQPVRLLLSRIQSIGRDLNAIEDTDSAWSKNSFFFFLKRNNSDFDYGENIYPLILLAFKLLMFSPKISHDVFQTLQSWPIDLGTVDIFVKVSCEIRKLPIV